MLGVMKIQFLAVVLSLATQPVAAQVELQRAHIEANVPQSGDFERFLKRDLLAYFNQSGGSSVTSVEVQPLRVGPTQSGVAYPKFYLWVKALAGTAVQQEGAVRVAAIRRTRFEVTDFLSVAGIQAKPSEVGTVFPAALVPAILKRAAAK